VNPDAAAVLAGASAGLERRSQIMDPHREPRGDTAGRRDQVQHDDDQAPVGSDLGVGPGDGVDAGDPGRDQFDDVGHGLDVLFRQGRRARAGRHGERAGQQPGRPALQGRGQAGFQVRKGRERILEAT
jgi:hypothetical protein